MIVAALLIVLLGALGVAAFCAAAETGFLSVSRGRILHMARAGGARAQVIQRAISDMARTTTALLVGNNLAGVTYSSASSALSAALFAGSPWADAAWSGVAACGMLMVGEFLPKLFFAARPLERILALAPSWRIFARVFEPVGAVVLLLIGRFLPKREAKTRVTPETVLKILEDRKDGVRLSDFESALIGRIMVLRAKNERISPDQLLTVLDERD